MDTAQFYSLIGKRVFDAREAMGFTQKKLGDKVGLSRASIANIEAGRQRILLHQAIDLAEALQISAAEELLPVDIFKVDSVARSAPKGELKLTGSEITKREAKKIARIVAAS